MKNLYLLLIASVCNVYWTNIQAQGMEEDFQRLSLNVHVIDLQSIELEKEDLSYSDYKSIKNVLEKRLMGIVTQNGFSGANRSPKFMIFPTLSLLDISYTSTAPTKIVYKLLVTLYVADFIDKRNYNSLPLELIGIGSSKQQALYSAINSLKNTKEVRDFIEGGKKKILQYYNDQCESILTEAAIFAKTEQYETAFNILFQIPKETKECYLKAIDRIPEYYALYQNQRCEENLQAAKILWAAKREANETSVKAKIETEGKTTEEKMAENYANGQKDESDASTAKQTITTTEQERYYQALDHLYTILPSSSCYKEAQTLLKEIKKYVEDKEYFETRQKYQDEKDIIGKALDLAIESQETQQEEIRKRRQEEAARTIIMK